MGLWGCVSMGGGGGLRLILCVILVLSHSRSQCIMHGVSLWEIISFFRVSVLFFTLCVVRQGCELIFYGLWRWCKAVLVYYSSSFSSIPEHRVSLSTLCMVRWRCEVLLLVMVMA